MSAVELDVADGIATVTLNRPERLNAFNADLSHGLLSALDRVREETVRVVVVTGAGTAFSAGSDIRENFAHLEERNVGVLLRTQRHPVLLGIRGLEKPVIAAVNGVAAGIGCSLALSCDLVVAATSAKFVFGFSRLGLIPDGGATWMLPRLVGHARATELALLGDPIDGPTAAALGLANRCVADELFEDAVDELARRLRAGPARAQALAKRALRQAWNTTFEEQLELEAELQEEAAASDDFDEGVRAFLEKRDPLFAGGRL